MTIIGVVFDRKIQWIKSSIIESYSGSFRFLTQSVAWYVIWDNFLIIKVIKFNGNNCVKEHTY